MKTTVTAKVRQITPDRGFRGISGELFTKVDGACCLGKRTIVFGRNGTGKTTFAELLRQVARGSIDRSDVTTNYFENGAWRHGSLPRSVVENIHVFNRYYIEDELAFFLDKGGSSPGILKLGAGNVEAEGKLRDAEATLERTRGRLLAIKVKGADLADEAANLKQRAKERVVDVLRPVLPAQYTAQRFNITKAHKALVDDAAASLSEDERQRHLEFLRADEFVPVQKAQSPAIELALLREAVNELAARELKNVVRAALDTDQALGRWIERGLELHPPGDNQCKFCESGVLSDELRAAYVAHFDRSLSQLRVDLDVVQDRLENAHAELERWQDAIPAADDFMPSYRVVWGEAIDALKEPLDQWRAYLVALDELIARRAANPQLVLDDQAPQPPAALHLDGMASVVAQNNDDVARQAELRATAEREVLNDLIEPLRAAYSTALRRAELADQVAARLDEVVRRLAQTVADWRDQQHEVGQMAELINQDLADHLGHVHLRLRVSDDGTGYQVVRSGRPARDLSEGERNSIALLYFLRSLEADGITPEHDLVVIDDPVTSLDRDALFAAFSLIDERTEPFGQVVVLTHDSEVFRLFLMRYKSALSNSRGAMKNGPDETMFPRIQFLEARTYDLQSGERGISFRPLPQLLLVQPTDYHYIFYRLADALKSADEKDLMLLGNAARRLLEGFVAFKAPTGNKFQDKVSRTARLGGVPNELTNRVVRFVHGASHRDEPNPSVTFDAAYMPAELTQVMRFIHLCDRSHFQGMCDAVGVDLSTLISQWDASGSAGVSTSGLPAQLPL
jgi:wobble nucleotide-excising tRNase